MKARCRTCKKWSRTTDSYRNCGYGKCLHSKLFNGHAFNQDGYPLDGLAVWQGNQLYAALETAALFGCVHHSPLPEGVTK